MKANDISRCKCISSRIIHNNMLESLTTIFSIAVNARLHTRPFECVRRKCFIFIERCVDVLVCYGFVSIELACIRIACVFPITVVILLLFFKILSPLSSLSLSLSSVSIFFCFPFRAEIVLIFFPSFSREYYDHKKT